MDRNFICVPINTHQFIRLSMLLDSTKSPLSPSDAIDHAIEYWMDNASWKPELSGTLNSESAAPNSKRNKQQGYQWKEIFLPEGTRLRMRYKNHDYYADVIGNQVSYEGESLSPGKLANKIANSARNAWRDFEIKRPGDLVWILADSLREAMK